MGFNPGKCRLTYWMRTKKITPTELADKVEMTVQEVSDYSHDRKKMTLGTAKAFSEALKVPIEELYDWTYTPSRKKRRQSKSE
jgi:transcriptional regulator with XRE-family HTH domain